MACAQGEQACSAANFQSPPIRTNEPQSALKRPQSVKSMRFNTETTSNPEPFVQNEAESKAMNEYLSPARLKSITGAKNLENVRSLEILVDTTENSLGNFGIYLPNLSELKLSNSTVTSVRDLGTTLKDLNVLWMARCGLQDVDGISSLPSIKELYLAFNNISDISGLGMLENLEVLDLESNNIDDVTQVYFLAMCPKLVTLTLAGNPVCNRSNPNSEELDYDYRLAVQKSLGSLKTLDGISLSERSAKLNSLLREEEKLVSEGIKYRAEEILPSSHPGTSYGSGTNLEAVETREESTEAQDNSSELTHGANQVICGNPSKALKARRSKLNVESPLTKSFVFESLALSRAEETPETECLYDESENRDQVFAELRRWREDYEQLTLALDSKTKIGPRIASQSVASFKPMPPKGPPRRVTPPSMPERPQSAADFRLRRFRVSRPDSGSIKEGEGIGEPLQARPPSMQPTGKRRRHVRPTTARPDLGNK